MSVPTPTVRQAPSGIYLKDGFSSKLTFAASPAVSLWEKNVKPVGVDGGDAIDCTTMHNVAWRTRRSRSLKTLTDGSATCAYDPAVLTQLVSLCNVETTITVTFRDGSTWAFYGYLQKFEPSELKEGEQAEASVTFIATNWDPVANVESGPAIASVAGT